MIAKDTQFLRGGGVEVDQALGFGIFKQARAADSILVVPKIRGICLPPPVCIDMAPGPAQLPDCQLAGLLACWLLGWLFGCLGGLLLGLLGCLVGLFDICCLLACVLIVCLRLPFVCLFAV